MWIAHMGSRCVKAIGQLFVRLETSSSSRPWKYGDGARRSSQGRPAGPPRSGLALTRSSTPSGWHGRGGSVGASSIRSSREANCTKIPLAAGRLERTKPFFVAALRGHAIHRFVHPDRPRLIGPRRLVFLGRGTTLNFAAIKFLV